MITCTSNATLEVPSLRPSACSSKFIVKILMYTKPINNFTKIHSAPSRHLIGESKEWKYQNNVLNMFKFSTIDTRTRH